MAEKKRRSVYNPEAQKRWNEKNKERINYLGARNASRSFIRNRATLEDLEELRGLIKEREQKLLAEVNEE